MLVDEEDRNVGAFREFLKGGLDDGRWSLCAALWEKHT